MQTVMGASPIVKLLICCGTLSSRIRKLPCGIFGMNRPLLSSTATSRLTAVTSLRKVGAPASDAPSFLLNLDGILGCSASTEPSFFFGRATVSPVSFFGPLCATAKDTARRKERKRRSRFLFFMRDLRPNYSSYSKDVKGGAIVALLMCPVPGTAIRAMFAHINLEFPFGSLPLPILKTLMNPGGRAESQPLTQAATP